MAKSTTLKEFESVFPKLEEALLEQAKKYKLPEDQLKWYQAVSCSHENCPGLTRLHLARSTGATAQ